MNLKHILNRNTLFILPMVALLAMSCEDDDTKVDRTGVRTAIVQSGAAEVYVGDEVSFRIPANLAAYDYVWQIGNGATITENPENDAFVDVLFSVPGDYTLTVSNDVTDATGEMPVEVWRRQVSFDTDSVYMMEGIVNDTLVFPLSISGGFNGNFNYEYTISGDLTAGVDYSVVPGYESPVTASADSLAEVRIVLLPDTDMDSDTLTFALTLTSLTPVLSDEYFLTDTLKKVSNYFVFDDLKMVSLDTATMELDSGGTGGIYEIPVMVSNPNGEDFTVEYSITGDDVSDATVSDTPGELVIKKGATEGKIILNVRPSAVADKQTIEITLDDVVASGDEVMLKTNYTSKKIMVVGK